MRARTAHVLQPGQKIRVLVVDDSVVIRRLVCHALEEDQGIDVVGTAADGRGALARIPQVNPDLITLDIEMPDMDGLEMLRELRRTGLTLPVVMFSTLTERGASATLEALSLGADDYVTKASNAGSLDVSMANLRHELIPKIRQFFDYRAAQSRSANHRPTRAENCAALAPLSKARGRDRCLHWRPGCLSKGHPAIPRRVSAAGIHCPAYAAALHTPPGRAARHTDTASGPGGR